MTKEMWVVTEAPTRWIHEETGETCAVEQGYTENVPAHGRCYDHQELIKRVIDPGTLVDDLRAAVEAADADSNDKEIDLLWQALDGAIGLLGVKMPEARPRCEECSETIDESDPHAGHGMCASCLHDALRSGWTPGDGQK